MLKTAKKFKQSDLPKNNNTVNTQSILSVSILQDLIAYIDSPDGEQLRKKITGKDGRDGFNGEDGKPGLRGERGLQGEPGQNGINGQQGHAGVQGPQGEPGKDGEDGEDGRGIVKLEIIRGNLWVFYTDGTKENLGRVEGEETHYSIIGQSNGASTASDSSIIDEANFYDASYSYTGTQLTLITFVDTARITGNTKTLSYTGTQLTQTVQVFTYESQVWTVTSSFVYTGTQLSSKTVNVVKV